ncbi:MAG: 50S ribosomal protein L35 [Rhodospirillales bacterium]|nr:50S ribosomal protein L35 [Rhodospirillales bacterium]MCB9965169.1 50S ribosomal protein L35 [Rhodospirillales bacterium]MCB9973188.1 50S ribosomal protein L35 [Rhodospirillales bacterium]MCB9979552.1 50S ribosomal protein L35 [Rhodospirillales bacterium]MCB9980740.1 50S ribosomal protein L35 [Rhodospirillales bacterium]
MPKMKTKSGAKKRFRVTASGKIKFKQSNTSHRLLSRPKSMKRKARGTEILNESDANILRVYMPYIRKRKTQTTQKKEEA